MNPYEPKPPIGVKRFQRGRIVIDEEALMNDAEAALALMAKLVVVKCEHNYCTRKFEYWAYCSEFEMVDPAIMTPIYEPVFTREPGQKITVKFRWKGDE